MISEQRAGGDQMPFRSEKQRRWMFANKPKLARKWARKYGSKIRRRKGGK